MPETEVPDDLVPMVQVARQFGVHRGTMFRWAAMGYFKVYRKPGERRSQVSLAEFERFMRGRPRDRGPVAMVLLAVVLVLGDGFTHGAWLQLHHVFCWPPPQ